jgi:hypothetical protein
LLLLLALAYSPTAAAASSVSSLIVASACVSLLAVASKGVYLSYALDRATLAFNACCFACDATGAAAVACTILVSRGGGGGDAQSASSATSADSWAALRWTLMPLSSAWSAGASTAADRLACSWVVKEVCVTACAL